MFRFYEILISSHNFTVVWKLAELLRSLFNQPLVWLSDFKGDLTVHG